MLAAQIFTHANIHNMVESWSKCSWIVRGSKQCKNSAGRLFTSDRQLNQYRPWTGKRDIYWTKKKCMEQARRVPQDVSKKSCAQTSQLRTNRHDGFHDSVGTVWDWVQYKGHSPITPSDKCSAITRSWCQGGVRPTAGPLIGFFKGSLKYEWVCDFLETRRVYKRIHSEENSPKGGGGEREAGEERAGGGTRVGSRTNRGKLRNNASYFAIDIGSNGENHR